MQQYHDTEWGVPVHDDQELYEFLVLEGAQAGLSWSTILNKRANYREALHQFDYHLIAQYTAKDRDRLLKNPGIIRNRLKIQSVIQNARVFIKIQKEFGSFDRYIWAYTNYKPIIHNFTDWSQVPAQTPLSQTIAKDLKKRGMNFVGPTIIYSYLQAIGMINDHLTWCFRYNTLI
jgi:DNA-3-methyladenine glycosylase I